MKRSPIFLILVTLFGLLLFHSTLIAQNEEEKEKEEIQGEEANEEEDTPPDRNMFGNYIPRGLTIKKEHLLPGYIMFSVPNCASTYLLNRDGLVVHEWKGNYENMTLYINNDGSLTQTARDPDFNIFAGGGESGRIQKLTWDSKLIWDFEYATDDYLTHHDIAIMPNGNILAIAWESKPVEECIRAGRNPDAIPLAGLWPDKIVEILPKGDRFGEVIWEWHMWDHMIQNYDPRRNNYGDPAEHPELVDINLGRSLPPPITQDSMDALHAREQVWRNQSIHNRGSDMHHMNAIDYNAELDQIVFSIPQLGEIYIIDHSTTTKEAAGHTGGRWGKGGDILYRWGNPQNYGRGDSTDHLLHGQHDVRWIEMGKPGAGNLTVFNNNAQNGPKSLPYSAIYEISPPADSKGQYVLPDSKPYGPETPGWAYTAKDTISFWSSFVSGVHRMKNGNTFITEGAKGRYFEVTPEGETVWEYLQQHRGKATKPNGDPVNAMPFAYFQFRATFIPADHPAFKGRELKPLEPQPEIFKLPPRPEPPAGNE